MSALNIELREHEGPTSVLLALLVCWLHRLCEEASVAVQGSILFDIPGFNQQEKFQQTVKPTPSHERILLDDREMHSRCQQAGH